MVDVNNLAAYPFPLPRGAQTMPMPTPTPVSPPAITLTIAELKEATGIATDEMATRLLAVASSQVEQYAPWAPSVRKNEAVIRFAGYLGGSDFGGVESESIGPRSVTYTPPSTNAAMFRNCGAAALLTTYRKRRGGLI